MLKIRSGLRRRAATKLAGAVSATGLVVAGLVVLGPAGPAGAACSTTIGLPARISVTGPYQEVKVPLHTSCTGLVDANADLYGPAGWETSFDWQPATNGRNAYLDVYGQSYYETATGSYHTRDGYAYDGNYNERALPEARTTVKLGSKVGISATRSGGWAHVHFTTWRYYTRYEGFYRGGGAQVDVSYLVGGKWKWISSPTSDRTGAGSVSFRTNDAHTYSVCVRERTYVWRSCNTIRT
ncbi:MAG: hypothetical protein ACR2F6_08225 [Mycobacteriales bacterium]